VNTFDPLPDDLAAAHAMILAERAARLEAEAQMSGARLEIERLKLLLAPRGSSDPRRFAGGSEDRWPGASSSGRPASAGSG
jgi:hypothetical protein